ncbi:Transcriptional repressor PagR (fragment) [Bacillus mycoides]|uniref:Transcriptional repressor PagR n=1 Tax=Bacillus mycoides TaxID=1405 RepID=A0A653YH67_BACMY
MNVLLDKKIRTTISEADIELLKVMDHLLLLKIISELINKTLNVTQLKEILSIPQSQTSKHLSTLKRNVLHGERKS